MDTALYFEKYLGWMIVIFDAMSYMRLFYLMC